ncbi:P-loop NTPase fold protein [Vibrio sp. 99-8-1]|uniref:KAP family P-loop NTPase fold protein n=1 Tax=Vibrio sp. 99-8-1 TaxID=2607602 RepID=UPI0014937974|nr:P-loop NTPase fold protein [Vibrio sp. 99-8-1]NOI65993.1 hypothetical protein [Vibrio sp. 99-8-1]
MVSSVSPEEVFEKYPIIQRREFAQHLTTFLNSKTDNGYVLNLNAEWGSGKTTFLQCWYNELKDNHPVIYFDAWKSDFSHDPMLALIDAFQEQLANAIAENKELMNRMINGTGHFIKAGLPSIIAGALKHKIGMDQDDSLFSDISDTLGIELGEEAVADSVKETLKAMLEQRRKIKGIHDFKEILKELGEQYRAIYKELNYPIYVLVDELDRCRPNYAIEIIECVKHFFNTDNFVFVLATDTEQLQHSIRAVYGEGFDSMSYLSRFFDNSVTLSAPDRVDYIKSRISICAEKEAWADLGFEFIDKVFDWHEIHSLREINKILDCIDIASTKEKTFKVFPLIILAILKRKYPEFLKRYERTANVPYNSSYNGVRSLVNDDQLVPGRIADGFRVTTQSSAKIDYMIHVILAQLEVTNVPDYAQYENRKSDNHESRNAISSFSSSIIINPENDNANKADYLSVINFAGHFA